MFKLKFVAGFVVLVVLQVAFIVYVFQGNLIPLTLDDTDIALERSASLVEKSHRLDEFSLQEKARHVADRKALRRAMVAEYEGDAESERHRAVHRELDTEHIRFTEFWGEESAGERNLDLDLLRRRPLDHDMFMALDDTGRLVATLGSGRAHLMGDNFADEFPIVLGAMERDETTVDMWNWSWRSGADRDLYIVAISPIRDIDDGEPVGVIVLGHRVTDDVASRARALITDGFGEDTVDALPTRKRIQSPDIAFFRGDTTYSSTLRSRQVSQLGEELFDRHSVLEHDQPEQILDVTIDHAKHRSIVRFFPGQFETDNPAGVVLLTSRDAAIAPVESARSQILVVSAGVVALGVTLFFVLFHLFLKPFSRLEEGVQEILSGDKDYVFEPDEKNEVAENLARHLNLLSAFLQGKPMPDEEVSLGGWDAFDPDGETESSKPSSVAGVPMGLGSRSADSSDDGDDEADGETEEKEGDEAAEETT